MRGICEARRAFAWAIPSVLGDWEMAGDGGRGVCAWRVIGAGERVQGSDARFAIRHSPFAIRHSPMDMGTLLEGTHQPRHPQTAARTQSEPREERFEERT